MNLNDSFQKELSARAALADRVVKAALPEASGYAVRVAEAARYSVEAGGKRLRPVFLYTTASMYTDFDAVREMAEPFMAAIELIHNYSLVHDDLPAMDNDLYRRGRKTTHAVYGAGIATLAGDELLNLAFETAIHAFDGARKAEERELCTDRVIRALSILSEKAGIKGMLGGQSADVDAEERQRSLDREELLFIHEKKTACMLESSLMIGAVLAGAPEEDIRLLEEAGHWIGLAFQVRDDILDVEGNEEILGKHVGSDAENGKTTYVTLYGLEQSKRDVEEMSEKALSLIGQLSVRDSFLTELVRTLVMRDK